MNGLTAKGLLGVHSSADFPVGCLHCSHFLVSKHFVLQQIPLCIVAFHAVPRQWFKGADTTFVLKFLVFKFETTLASDALQGHSDLEYLRTILECLKASDGFLSSLYKAGLFLTKRRLIKVVRLGMAMLTSYTRIAAMAHSRLLPIPYAYACGVPVDAGQGCQPITREPSGILMPNARGLYQSCCYPGKGCEPKVCARENLVLVQGRSREGVGVKKCEGCRFVSCSANSQNGGLGHRQNTRHQWRV